jgi:hypothetical protein
LRDANGAFVQNSLDPRACRDQKLNEPVRLEPDTYRLMYSSTDLFVDLRGGEKRVIDLSRLSVPRSVYCDAFRDLTDPGEQGKHLRLAWFRFTAAAQWGDGMESDPEAVCARGGSDPFVARACAAWRSGDYRNLGAFFRFNADGNPDAPKFENQMLYLVGSGSLTAPNGDFLSVFPGTYGIACAHEPTRFGIVVK